MAVLGKKKISAEKGVVTSDRMKAVTIAQIPKWLLNRTADPLSKWGVLLHGLWVFVCIFAGHKSLSGP